MRILLILLIGLLIIACKPVSEELNVYVPKEAVIMIDKNEIRIFTVKGPETVIPLTSDTICIKSPKED